VTTPIQDEIFLVIVRVRLAAPASRGKSRAAKRVASRLNGDVISKEVYSLEMSHPFPEPPEKQNYDAPNGMDGQGPESHIRNQAAAIPSTLSSTILDFTQNLPCNGRRKHIPAKSMLILEDKALRFAQLRPTSTYLSTWKFPKRSVTDADRSA
jgi:hypothetical protein